MTLCILAAQPVFATAQQKDYLVVSGRTCDDKGTKIDYATIILTPEQDSTRTYGVVSDSDGQFALSVPRGAYRLEATYIGYEKAVLDLNLQDNTELGNIEMKPSAIGIESVVVKGKFITYEADRYVVNVADSPLAIGKTADEVLKLAPGVWIKDGISINGRSNTHVMINNRLLRETGEELVAYLNTIKAEDIQRIEVVPNAGTEYDADSAGGIIKITLRRQRDNGIDGSLSARYSYLTDYDKYTFAPTVNLKYRYNNLSLYTRFTYQKSDNLLTNEDRTTFTGSDNRIVSNAVMDEKRTMGSGLIGIIYDIGRRQSFGIEAELGRFDAENPTLSHLTLTGNGTRTDVFSRYSNRGRNDRIGMASNYVLNLDTLGSTFKILLDYNKRIGRENQDNNSAYRGSEHYDSIYYSVIDNRNLSTSAAANFDIRMGKTLLKAGAKYTFNQMNNATLYEYMHDEVWYPIGPLSNLNLYDENISALYADFSNKFANGASLGFGLRAEYTYAIPSTRSTVIKERQEYWGFFPNFNLSFPLNEKKSQMLALNYNRKIRRPAFWQINPFRTPLSEYSFVVGNPLLRPTYLNSFSVQWIIAQKFSITAQTEITENAIQQIVSKEQNDVIIYRWENIKRNYSYLLAVNLPLNVTKWWLLNASAVGGRTEVALQDHKESQDIFQGNLGNTLTIRKKYYLDLQGFYQSSVLSGNFRVKPIWQANASLKRSFANNRFTASVFLNNIFNSMQTRIDVHDPAFERSVRIQQQNRIAGLSFRYNFKAGISVRTRNVESAAEEDKSRL